MITKVEYLSQGHLSTPPVVDHVTSQQPPDRGPKMLCRGPLGRRKATFNNDDSLAPTTTPQEVSIEWILIAYRSIISRRVSLVLLICYRPVGLPPMCKVPHMKNIGDCLTDYKGLYMMKWLECASSKVISRIWRVKTLHPIPPSCCRHGDPTTYEVPKSCQTRRWQESPT